MHLLRPIVRFAAASALAAWAVPLLPAQTAPAPAASAQASSASAQAPAGAPTVLHANTNLVLVDVVVTSHDRPIHNLPQSRFHILEDGHEQTIVTFDEHQPGSAATPSIASIALPPHTVTNAPQYEPASAVNVLLLDGLNTPLANQIDVRR